MVNQSFKDVQLLVIDGGSTDHTLQVLEKYRPEIDTLISEKDAGIYHAMNKALLRARGEWVFFLGSDDELINLRVLDSIFPIRTESQLLYGDVMLSGNGIVGQDGQIYDGEFSKLKLCRKNICQQSIIYHRSLFDVIGPFDLGYPVLADWIFNISAFARKETKPLYIKTLVSKYHAGGQSNIQCDPCADRDRVKLIRQLFGFRFFLAALFFGKLGRYL